MILDTYFISVFWLFIIVILVFPIYCLKKCTWFEYLMNIVGKRMGQKIFFSWNRKRKLLMFRFTLFYNERKKVIWRENITYRGVFNISNTIYTDTSCHLILLFYYIFKHDHLKVIEYSQNQKHHLTCFVREVYIIDARTTNRMEFNVNWSLIDTWRAFSDSDCHLYGSGWVVFVLTLSGKLCAFKLFP